MELKLISAEELMMKMDFPASKETEELEYRRGYCDGWIIALEAIHDLMFQKHMNRQEAYERLWDFWGNSLKEWHLEGARRHQRGESVKLELPPEPDELSG